MTRHCSLAQHLGLEDCLIADVSDVAARPADEEVDDAPLRHSWQKAVQYWRMVVSDRSDLQRCTTRLLRCENSVESGKALGLGHATRIV